MGNDSYKYQVDERKKYQKIEAVEDKWIRIHKDFSPYVDEHILFRCMKEAFNLVDIVMGNKIYGFKNANTPANTEIMFIFNRIFFKLISVSPLILHLQWVQMKNN